MSIVQNDQEIVRDRKDSIKDVDALLVDQIPKKLMARLEELEFGAKVGSFWLRGNAHRTLWLERQQTYLADWDDFLVNSIEGPFNQSSNLHIPSTFTIVKTYHARMLQALLATEPMPTPRRADAIERTKAVGDLMHYALHDWANRNQGVEETLDGWVWDWCSTGQGVLKLRWDCLYEKFIDVQQVTEQGPPQFKVGADGNEQVIPTFKQVEKEVEVQKEVFNGPVLERVLPEDFLLQGGDGTVEGADYAIHRQYLTKSDLYTLAYRKVFDLEKVEKVITGGPSHLYNDASTVIKQQRARNDGTSGAPSYVDQDRYEILECYARVDVDYSGVDTNVVMWVHQKSGEILRATYLRRVNKAGTRPFAKADFHKRQNQPYPMGLVEILYPLSKELDFMHNTRVDFGMLSTMPFGFYRASSSLDADTITYEPGQLIPLDNPQTDVYFPQLGNRTSFGMQEEQMIGQYIERLTGISDLSLGVMSGSQGATRTATGARALQGEASSNLDVHLRRLFRSWKVGLKYLCSMLQQRVPEGLGFKVTGEDGNEYWRYIRNRDDIAGDFDFEIDPSSAESNPQLKLDRATNILQTIANPLYLQIGAVTSSNLYEALKNYLLALGSKGYSRYITKPADYSIALTPEEIANRVLRGQDVPILPTDDNQGFLDFFAHILKDDSLLGQFNETETVALARHAQQRESFLQSLKNQQAQASNLAQQRTNAQSASNQTPMMGGGVQAPPDQGSMPQ